MQEMSAERDDGIIRAQSRDHGGFAGHVKELDGPEVYRRRGAVKGPDAGLPAVVEYRSQRHLKLRPVALARKPARES